MKENKKWLVLAVMLIIVIPIVLNFLILRPSLLSNERLKPRNLLRLL